MLQQESGIRRQVDFTAYSDIFKKPVSMTVTHRNHSSRIQGVSNRPARCGIFQRTCADRVDHDGNTEIEGEEYFPQVDLRIKVVQNAAPSEQIGRASCRERV